MLYRYDEYMLRLVSKQTIAEYHRQADIQRLLNDLHEREPNRLAKYVHSLSRNLEHLLVVFTRGVHARSARART